MDSDIMSRIAESKIAEAIEDGLFDNLPGKGKPIVFEDDVSIPLHVRMANKVLKNAGVLPEWIQFRKDIQTERTEVARLLHALPAENAKRTAKLGALQLSTDHPYLAAYAAWHAKSRAKYLAMLKSVNTSILKFNMYAPGAATGAEGFAPYKIDVQMKAFDEAFAQYAGVKPESSPEQDGEGALRTSVRVRYQALKKP